MKHLIVVLGIATCFLNQASAQNTPGNALEPTRVVPSKAKSVTKTTTPVKSQAQTVYYITNVPATGSHIPMVIRRYKGESTVLFSSQPGSKYTAGDIGLTGALSVSGALNELDPAISSASGITRSGR